MVKKLSAKEKSASNRSDANSVSYIKTTPAASSVSTSGEKSKPYYTGSEIAVRDYVLLYLKTKQSLVSFAGTYKILGNVSSEGKLKIISIIQITKVNCNCENIIIEALNTMTKWNPAIEEGKNVASNVEFTLAF